MAVGYNSFGISDNLIVCLDAGNTKSYSGTGTSLIDISGNNNNFTIVGSPSFSTGIFTLTGDTTKYFICNPFNHPTSTLTVEIWCLINTGSVDDGIWSYSVSGNDNNELLYAPQNLALYGPNSIGTSGINVADSNWKQIVRTSDRSTGSEVLYVNGSPVYSITQDVGVNFTAGGSFVIGQEQDLIGGGFDINQSMSGQFSILKIYNRVLSSSEVTQNFNAIRGRFGI